MGPDTRPAVTSTLPVRSRSTATVCTVRHAARRWVAVERNPARWVAGGLSAASGRCVPPAGADGRHGLPASTTSAFLGTLRRMRGGQGYYPAMRDTFLDGRRACASGGPRSFRLPYLFEVLGAGCRRASS